MRDEHNNFVKHAPAAGDMYRCEADGLGVLAAAGVIRTPRIISVSDDEIVLERIFSGPRKADFDEDFGRRMARLHQIRGKTCGYPIDNYIGRTPQRNTPLVGSWEEAAADDGSNWPEFFMERRLRFQVDLAIRKGHGKKVADLFDRAEANLRELLSGSIEPPGLLHGDLWAGNYLVDENGDPCLVDPAVYYGHREAELAMTRLFGGFTSRFYGAYREAWPLQPGYEERLPIYQLYHVINHLNLFGHGYHKQAVTILKQYV